MLKKLFSVFTFLLISVTLLWIALPVSASNQNPQALYQTPTAGTDGRIIYTIKKGDTCLSISLLTGIDQDTLRKNNNLDQNCTLIEGQKLLLGTYQAPTNTPGPSPTPTPILPTPTPFNGSGQICVMLYNDINGNARLETNELPIPGGAVLVTDKKTGTPRNQTTSSSAARVCFNDLPEGDYNISVAPPQGYNPTTSMNSPITLQAGDISYLDFGAQMSAAAVTPQPSEGGRSPMLGIAGGVLVLAGIGLGLYFKFLSR